MVPFVCSITQLFRLLGIVLQQQAWVEYWMSILVDEYNIIILDKVLVMNTDFGPILMSIEY